MYAKREDFSETNDDLRTGVRDVEVEQILNDSAKIKKKKKKRKEGEDISEFSDDLRTGVRDVEVEQISNDSAKIKKKKKKRKEGEDISEFSDDLRMGVRDVEVEHISNDFAKKKKKRKEREDISEFSDDLRMGVRDVEVEQISNDSAKIKKKKKKRKEGEDISEIIDDFSMGVRDVEVEHISNDFAKKKKKRKEREDISEFSDDLRDIEVEQISNDSVKKNKKRKEREDISEISDDLRTGVKDIVVEHISNDSAKKKKKRKEREDFSGIGTLETSMRDDVTVKVNKSLNNYVTIKKRKEQCAERGDFSGDDLGASLMGVEVKLILNDSVKRRKRKEKSNRREEFPGIAGDLETIARGDEMTVKGKRDVNNSFKIKREKKFSEMEELSEIHVDARTGVSDGVVTAEVKENLNASVTLEMVKQIDLKRQKDKTKMHSEGEAFNIPVNMSSQPQEGLNSMIGKCTDSLGMECTNRQKKNKSKSKCKEIDSIECRHSVWHNSGNSDEYLPESTYFETVNLLFSGSRENKGKYKNVAGEICATSLLADKKIPPDEGTDVNDDFVTDVESGKKKEKQKKMPNCQDKEMYSNLPSFSDGADKLSISSQKLNNSQSVFELGNSDAVKRHLITELLDNARKNIIPLPTISNKSKYDVPENIEYGNRHEIDSVVSEEVKKAKRKNSLKMKKDSLEVEVDAESDSKESRVDEMDGSSTPDERITEEIANNSSTIIENDSNSPLRQEPVDVCDEEDIDVDRSLRRSTRGKFRLSSDGVDKSSHSSSILSCEFENENSPSDINPYRHCKTTMQTTSIKDSKRSKCYYACDECNRVYTRKDNLAIHKKVKHECMPMFKCSDCGKTFQYKHVLKDHILCIHGCPVTFDCELCSYKTKKEHDLEKHIMAMHEGMVFQCSSCGNTFKCESNLRRHMKIVHLKQNDFVCALCGKFFSQASNLKQHMKNVHSEGTLTCTICECKFENRHKFSMHLLGHAPKVGFNCQYCDYVLVSKSDARMKRHVKEKHSDMKDVQSKKTCVVCEREFDDLRKLRMHQLGQHLPKVGLNCQYCDYVSESDDRMKRHIKEMHLDVKQSSSQILDPLEDSL